MPLLQVILGSPRPNRSSPAIGAWFVDQARAHGGFDVEAIDLAEVNLPFIDEPAHPRLKQYTQPHTIAWSERISRGDAYVFVTPEYNFGTSPLLLNALDYLLHEWAYKAAGIVSYGGVSGGTRAAQMLKQVLTTLKIMPMYEAVAVPFFAQYMDKETGNFAPGATQDAAAKTMLDELAKWDGALRTLRGKGLR